MSRTFKFRAAALSVCAALLATGSLMAQDIALPKPATSGGMPLMEALAKRHSGRAYLPKELPKQELSDLLWAAFGINREDGKRTAPSARNYQEIDIYVMMKSGVYVYDAKADKLVQKSKDDIRASVGIQPFVKDAPVVLLYVADLAKMAEGGKGENRMALAHADSGFISQNVYLYCASKGLSTVVLGLIKRAELAKILNLPEDAYIITYGQSLGYPDPARAMR
jgi:SagB-type dehydrogenase family enzyme